MCLKKKKEKRYIYNNFQYDPFLDSLSNSDIPLLNITKLTTILNGLKFRFQSIFDFYNSPSVDKNHNKEIEIILLITLKELEIIKKIFSKCEQEKIDFNFDEEISFICLYNDSTYQFTTFNLNSINDPKKIFSKNETKTMKNFLDTEVKNYKELYLNLLNKINPNANVNLSNDELISEIINYNKNRKILDYSYYLIEIGMEYNENKIFDTCAKYLEISEFIFEYIIFIKIFWKKNVNANNMNNFELVEKFFDSDEKNIELSSYLLQERKNKYVFISFIGGIFRDFFEKQEISQKIDFEKKDENYFDGIVQFYPNLMELIIDAKNGGIN